MCQRRLKFLPFRRLKVGLGSRLSVAFGCRGRCENAAQVSVLESVAVSFEPDDFGVVDLETHTQAMTALPQLVPAIGLSYRIGLARDYDVRVDSVDYSVDPRMIGRFVDVDVTANPAEVIARCERQVVARHVRSLAKHAVTTDPMHVTIAARMRHGLAADRHRRTQAANRSHIDGHYGGAAGAGLRRLVRC